MIWILLIAYQFKHFIADYPLQGRFMLGKFKPYPDYIMPLFCHALVHAIFTFIIGCFVDPDHATFYAVLDGGIHFIVDRIKASPDLLGRFKALSANEMKSILADEAYAEKFPGTQTTHATKELNAQKLKSNTYFWWSLGLDQMCHHLSDILIIWLLMR